MKVNYDAKTDTLTVVFRDVPVAETDEDKPGVILDYDATGNIVSIEVLDASRRVEEPRKVTTEPLRQGGAVILVSSSAVPGVSGFVPGCAGLMN